MIVKWPIIQHRVFSTTRTVFSKHFSNAYVTENLKRYFHLRQFDKAMMLAKRLESAQWIPSAQQMDYLVSILADMDEIKSTGACLLNMLNVVSERKLKVSAHTIRRFAWEFRKCQDPFIRKAAHELLYENRQLIKYKELEESKYWCDLISGYLSTFEVDQAYAKYMELKNRYGVSEKVPFIELAQKLLIQQEAFVEAKEVCNDALAFGIDIPSKISLLLLGLANSHSHIETLKFSWGLLTSQKRLSHVPDGMLTKTLQVAGEHGSMDLMEPIASEFASRGLNEFLPIVASSIVEGISTHSPIERILRTLETMHLLQPKLDTRDFPVLMEGLASYNVNELYDRVSAFCTKNSNQLLPGFLTLIMNLVLASLRTFRTPSSMFYMYRRLEQTGFTPDTETLQQLVFGAYRLGDSKKLSYLIYHECCVKYQVTPSRQTFETLIRIALTGKRYDTVFYFLSEMHKYRVPMREHVNRSIMKRFDRRNDSRYRDLFPHVANSLKNYSHFVSDDALESSVSRGKYPYNYQKDSKNAHDFIHGWNPDFI
ncbi:hypothetical protein TRICI_001566 [Trichomonascus ciferrii]|uniref:Uncharacterized protein n=1 Tax=Trichomonascus ciferrii TaxID=44093 RepID=A0A642VCI9_9ASCO|nr:hypothetical protein TRICI_001566 [Trichomonascus ciferrii]